MMLIKLSIIVVMTLSQLQGQFSECQKLQYLIETGETSQRYERQLVAKLQRATKERRFQISSLQYQLKQDLKGRSHKKQYYKRVEELQKQLKNTESINLRIGQEYNQLTNLCTNARHKIDHVQNRIDKTLKEIKLAEKYKRQLQKNLKIDERYSQLQKFLESQLLISRQLQDKYIKIFDHRKNELLVLDHQVDAIDQQTTGLDDKVRIQKQLIEGIIQTQIRGGQEKEEEEEERIYSKTSSAVNIIMNQAEAKEFKRKEDLDTFEKIQLQDIVRRRNQLKKEDKWRMGKILRQKKPAQPYSFHISNYGKIVNRKDRQHNNFTEMIKRNHAKTDLSQNYTSDINQLKTPSKIGQLQKGKRVRTRQTQMKRFSQIYKHILSNTEQSYHFEEKQSPKSILEVYEQLKKQSAVNRRSVGNIEIVKFIKINNKWKGNRGQRSQFELGKLA